MQSYNIHNLLPQFIPCPLSTHSKFHLTPLNCCVFLYIVAKPIPITITYMGIQYCYLQYSIFLELIGGIYCITIPYLIFSVSLTFPQYTSLNTSPFHSVFRFMKKFSNTVVLIFTNQEPVQLSHLNIHLLVLQQKQISANYLEISTT